MKESNHHYEGGEQDWFQAGGLRPTRTRKLLFEVFKKSKGPQSVPELLQALAKKKYTPHKTTLYREVEGLVARGFLSKVQLSEERVSYELSGYHHHHFVCDQCARVTELSFCEEVLKNVSHALEGQGKYIRHHTFEFFGICELCSQ